jgi:probable F420-dependent oxidoreductase
MNFGVAMFATDEGIRPADLARLVEGSGFESLFFPEHTHIPATRESDAPRGGELPREYSRTYDLFVALTEAACATERLRIGSGICLIVERDPIATAKAVASLDVLSGGRLLLGIGAGWNREEMRNHGTDPDRRFALMKHRVRAMKEIWTSEEASYESPYVAFQRIWAWPKPVQRPHPPILVGGNGAHAIDRVLAYGDEWLPEPEPGLIGRIAGLQRRAREVGLDEIPVTVYGAQPADVEAYRDAGVHRCVFWVPPRDPARTERRVLELAKELG